jgi:uncharacterized protein (TIGR03435 family)
LAHPPNFWTVVLITIGTTLPIGTLDAPRVCAQVPAESAANSPGFEVASIKPNKSSDVLSSAALQGGRFTATNITLRELIRVAYDVQNAQIAGGPSWIGSERFDIEAKAEGDPTLAASPRSMLLMVRRLLRERFKLTAHTEMRELQAYALVMDRTDRRMGPELRQSQVDCAAVMAAARTQPSPLPFPPPGERQLCDMFIGAPPRFAAGGVSMAQLATSLSRLVKRTVLDRTLLTGTFDFELQWTPEGLPQRSPDAVDQPIRLNGSDVDPNGPSIFTALREQLGLKLESKDGPVDVLVVDSASRPNPD